MAVPKATNQQQDDDDASAGYEVTCCEINLLGSSSQDQVVEATKLPKSSSDQALPPPLSTTASSDTKSVIGDAHMLVKLLEDATKTTEQLASFLRTTSSSRNSLNGLSSRATVENGEDEEQPNSIYVQRSTSSQARGRTTSLRSTSSSKPSVSLNRLPSRPTNVNDEDDEEQPTIEVQRSTSQTSRGDATAGSITGILKQPSRSRSFANSQSNNPWTRERHAMPDGQEITQTQSGNINVEVEQSEIAVQRSSSTSQARGGDSFIAIQSCPSDKSQPNQYYEDVQDDLVDEKGFDIALSFPQEQEHVVQEQEQEQQKRQRSRSHPQQKRQRRSRRTTSTKKCITIATISVCLGLLAGLVALFLSTDTLVKQSLLRYSPTKDSDGDGLSDELEMQLGLDPMNPDSDGDGTGDGDEFVGEGVSIPVYVPFVNNNPESDGDNDDGVGDVDDEFVGESDPVRR